MYLCMYVHAYDLQSGTHPLTGIERSAAASQTDVKRSKLSSMEQLMFFLFNKGTHMHVYTHTKMKTLLTDVLNDKGNIYTR